MLNANYLLARLRRGPRRQVPAGRLRPPLHARVRPLGRADEARARAQDARRRQAPARLRLPPADRLLPAAGRGGADGRADRDRDQGEPRRVRRRDRGDPRRGRARPRDRRSAPYTTPVRRLDEATRKPAAGVRQPLCRSALRKPCRRSELRQLLLQLEHRREEVAVLLDSLEHVGGLEDAASRRRRRSARASTSSQLTGVETVGCSRPAGSRRRSSSCAGRSGTSRRRPCPCARPSSFSRRPGRASASRAAGRSRGRTVWSSVVVVALVGDLVVLSGT